MDKTNSKIKTHLMMLPKCWRRFMTSSHSNFQKKNEKKDKNNKNSAAYMCRCSRWRRSWEKVVITSRFMQSCKTSEGDSSSLQVCNSGVGPITRDPYPTRSTWICTTGPWGLSIEGLLYCQQRNDCTSFCRRDQAGSSSEKNYHVIATVDHV